jgi:hypothetical protein
MVYGFNISRNNSRIMVRNMLGLPEAKWKDEGEEQQRESKYPQQHHLDLKQSTLSDFLE